MARVICFFLFALAAVKASPLPACSGAFQYSCVQATTGGYYVLTPLTSTGSIEITGFTSGGTQVFDAVMPQPQNTPENTVIDTEIALAQAQIVLQTGTAASLPSCALPGTQLCWGGAFNYSGGSTVLTGMASYTFAMPLDTFATQTVNQYSTTLIAKLNGSHFLRRRLGRLSVRVRCNLPYRRSTTNSRRPGELRDRRPRSVIRLILRGVRSVFSRQGALFFQRW